MILRGQREPGYTGEGLQERVHFLAKGPRTATVNDFHTLAPGQQRPVEVLREFAESLIRPLAAQIQPEERYFGIASGGRPHQPAGLRLGLLLRRIGWVALVAQPLVTFAIMVLVHADVDTRVMMLMAMVVGIIVVDTYLIVISYLDTNLAHQLALANLSAEELQKRASGQIGGDSA